MLDLVTNVFTDTIHLLRQVYERVHAGNALLVLDLVTNVLTDTIHLLRQVYERVHVRERPC